MPVTSGLNQNQMKITTQGVQYCLKSRMRAVDFVFGFISESGTIKIKWHDFSVWLNQMSKVLKVRIH